MTTTANKLLITTIIFFSSLYTYGNSHLKRAKTDSTKTDCLQIIGIALDEKNEAINGAEVKLYKENEEMEWEEVTNVTYHDHNFSFRLEPNQYYTVEISKKGFISRSVAISTAIPKNIDLSIMFQFEFEVTLDKENLQMDDYYLDFPVALISYNSKTGVFENNNIYTRHIKSKIKEAQEQAEIKKLLRTNN
ncbi:MAG: hypothetical protein ACXVPU_03780 [Bacteroidia bacterium]